MNVNLITPKATKERKISQTKSPIQDSEKSDHSNPNESEMQKMIRKNKIARGWSDMVGTPDFDPKSMQKSHSGFELKPDKKRYKFNENFVEKTRNNQQLPQYKSLQ